LAARPEIASLASLFIQEDETAPLIAPLTLARTETGTTLEAPRLRQSKGEGHWEKEEKSVFLRKAAVLGKRTIIKSDYYEARTKRDKALAKRGIPRFRHLEDLPIIAVGQPSISGVRSVLDSIRNTAGDAAEVVWLNLREEPVVYLRDSPFVLRDFYHPFRILPVRYRYAR